MSQHRPLWNPAVLITFDKTDDMRAALLAGWDIVGAWPSYFPGPLGGPSASIIVALRGRVADQPGGVVDRRMGETVPDGWFA